MSDGPRFSAFLVHFPYLGLFVLLILGGVGLPFPEDATLILCGTLISTKVIRPLPAICVTYAGVLVADFFLYAFGKKYGPAIISHKRFRKVISGERLKMLKERFDRWGVLVVLIGRHLIGVRSQILLAAGVMRMPPAKFLIADGLSSLFTMGLMVGAGYMGGNSLQIIRRDMTRLGHLVVAVVFIGLIVYLLSRFVALRRMPPQ